jgi:O-antigen ligase
MPAVKTIVERSPTGFSSAWSTLVASGIGLTIFSASLAFGATQPWSIYACEVAFGILFLGSWTRMVVRSDFSALRNPLLAPILLFAMVVVIQITFQRTAYAAATIAETLRYVGYFCLFVAATDSLRSRTVSHRFLSALVIFGAVLAVEAIAQDLSSPGKIYWRIAVPASGTVFGPYASHGLFAGFMEMVAGVAIVKWLIMPRTEPRWLLWGFCALLTSSSIVLSRSRAGMLALVCEIVFVGLLLVRRSGRKPRMLMVVLTALIVCISAWLGSAPLMHRAASVFDALNNDVNGHRLTIAADGLRMFRTKPLLGWGLDVFPVVYPRFRSFATHNFINEAHNDYVQVLMETGVAGAAAVALFVVLLYWKGLKRLNRRPHSSMSWPTAAALVGCTGMLVHNLFDFNFHIVGNAALFYVLAAIATAPANSEDRPASRQQRPRDILKLIAQAE